MAVHKAAQKRMKQSSKRHMRNRHTKSTIRTMVKRVREAVQERNETGASEALVRVTPLVDKAVSKGVLHWRNGARTVSRLTRLVNTMRSGS